MISNTKILITGGAGFIGSNLCDALINLGNRVVCLDNFSTGKMENIESLLSNPQFKLITGDIRNLDDCRKAVEGVDYVLHEAALGYDPKYNLRDGLKEAIHWYWENLASEADRPACHR